MKNTERFICALIGWLVISLVTVGSAYAYILVRHNFYGVEYYFDFAKSKMTPEQFLENPKNTIELMEIMEAQGYRFAVKGNACILEDPKNR